MRSLRAFFASPRVVAEELVFSFVYMEESSLPWLPWVPLSC